MPVTVIDGLVDLHATIEAYEKADDVWTIGFLEGNAKLRCSLSFLFASFRFCVFILIPRFMFRFYVETCVVHVSRFTLSDSAWCLLVA